jgi:hypothetical protein
MNLAELAGETLTQKHRRKRQERCRHKEIYSSSVTSDWGDSTNSFCLDCGKSWHTHSSPSVPAKRLDDGTKEQDDGK